MRAHDSSVNLHRLLGALIPRQPAAAQNPESLPHTARQFRSGQNRIQSRGQTGNLARRDEISMNAVLYGFFKTFEAAGYNWGFKSNPRHQHAALIDFLVRQREDRSRTKQLATSGSSINFSFQVTCESMPRSCDSFSNGLISQNGRPAITSRDVFLVASGKAWKARSSTSTPL